MRMLRIQTNPEHGFTPVAASLLQRAAVNNSPIHAVPPIVHEALRSPGQPLDTKTRAFMEPRFGYDFSGVRIHTDTKAAESARAVSALAYTVGRDVVFGAGQFAPRSSVGQWLVAHELTHIVQQRVKAASNCKPQNFLDLDETTLNEYEADRMAHYVVSDNMQNREMNLSGRQLRDSGVIGLQRQKLPGDSKGERKSVEDAINSLESDAKSYQTKLLSKGITLDEAIFQRQLSSWKVELVKSQGTIDSSLSKDATLTQNLKSAYQNAVNAAIAFAVDRLGQTSHEVYDKYRDMIAEWALPQAVAEPTGGELSERLPQRERQKLTVVTTAVIFDVDNLFSTKIAKTTIPLPVGVTARFASGVPAKLQDGLKNVAGTIIPDPLKLNSTITLALDLEPYGGDYSTYRFTYLEHTSKGGKSTQEVLIERLGAVGLEGLAKSQSVAAQKKFDAHNFKRGSGWSDPEFASVLAGIAQISDAILSPVDGITFNRDRVNKQDPNTGGNYNPDTHTITMFDRAFKISPTRFGSPGAGISTDTTRAVTHEIGHAVDLLPLRQAWDSLEQKRKILQTAFAQYENPPGSGSYSFPNTEQAKFNKLKNDIQAAEIALTAARAGSGERYSKDASGTFKMVEGGTAAGSIEFRLAAGKDGGKRITTYSNKEWQEYYAESFSLYITDPGTLQRLRPNVYAFFSKKYPN